MQHHLRLYTQKKDNTIEFLLDPISFMGLDRFGLGRNNLHDFGKFDATASSNVKGRLILRFFYLARIVNFSNQLVGPRPERARNLNLLDSE